MPFQWIPLLLQIFSGRSKVGDNHMTGNTWQLWNVLWKFHEHAACTPHKIHKFRNSPSARPPSPGWDKSFWQRPYTSASLALSLQMNNIIDSKSDCIAVFEDISWTWYEMIKTLHNKIRTSTSIGLKVPDSRFLIMSSSLRTSSQGVKQTILREQSSWCFCCALPSYITGAPTTLANTCNTTRWHLWEAQGKAGSCKQAQDCIHWRWHHERHIKRKNSMSHESIKFGIEDRGWVFNAQPQLTAWTLQYRSGHKGIHWTYT